MIGRGEDGRATAWRPGNDDGKARSWRRDGGWSEEGGATAQTPGASGPVRAPRPSSYGFVGASLASSDLRALARDLDAHGQGTHPLRAELALRTAVAAGAAIVPILALVLAYAFGVARDVRLVALGILAAAAYWIALAVAWNGAAQGALSPLWVSAGVPLLFAVFAAAVSLRIAAR